MVVVKIPEESSSPSNRGFVLPGSNEELIAEIDVLRNELGSLVRELREFVKQVRDSNGDWTAGEIIEAVEEIVNGG